MSLLKKVQGHVRGQRTSGQNTLALAVECIDHMFGPSGDWTPLAYLISKSEPAQSRRVKSIVRKTVHGWSWSDKDARFTKIKGKNQGVDTRVLDLLRVYVGKGTTIQTRDEEFGKLIGKEKAAPKDFDAKAWADRAAKDHSMAELSLMIAALEAKRAKMGVALSEPAH